MFVCTPLPLVRRGACHYITRPISPSDSFLHFPPVPCLDRHLYTIALQPPLQTSLRRLAIRAKLNRGTAQTRTVSNVSYPRALYSKLFFWSGMMKAKPWWAFTSNLAHIVNNFDTNVNFVREIIANVSEIVKPHNTIPLILQQARLEEWGIRCCPHSWCHIFKPFIRHELRVGWGHKPPNKASGAGVCDTEREVLYNNVVLFLPCTRLVMHVQPLGVSHPLPLTSQKIIKHRVKLVRHLHCTLSIYEVVLYEMHCSTLIDHPQKVIFILLFRTKNRIERPGQEQNFVYDLLHVLSPITCGLLRVRTWRRVQVRTILSILLFPLNCLHVMFDKIHGKRGRHRSCLVPAKKFDEMAIPFQNVLECWFTNRQRSIVVNKSVHFVNWPFCELWRQWDYKVGSYLQDRQCTGLVKHAAW